MRGFLVVLGIGLVMLALAAWRDRQTRHIANSTLGIPVERLEPSPVSAPDESQRAALSTFRRLHPRFDARLADDRFANWADPATVELPDADLLCCPEGVGSMRELVDSLGTARRAGRQLVVICPDPEATLVELLAAIPTGTARTPVLAADAQTCVALARATGGAPATRADLQSGAASRGHGRARRLVVDASGCWVQTLDQA